MEPPVLLGESVTDPISPVTPLSVPYDGWRRANGLAPRRRARAARFFTLRVLQDNTSPPLIRFWGAASSSAAYHRWHW